MTLLDRLEAWVGNHPGEPVQVVVTWDEKLHEWAGAMFAGKEAEDSPMWGGAAHSIAPTVHEAIEQLFNEFRLPDGEGSEATGG